MNTQKILSKYPFEIQEAIQKLLLITPFDKKNQVVDEKTAKRLNDNIARNYYTKDRISKLFEIRENNAWYSGSADDLTYFYTIENFNFFTTSTIFSQIIRDNRATFFWNIANKEKGVKKIHSGLPRTIVETLSNAVGVPQVETNDPVLKNVVEKIFKENNFENLILQEQQPLTLVEGYGAFKIDFDKKVSKYPLISYYRAKDVEYIVTNNLVTGIVYHTTYYYDKEYYSLIELRYNLESVSHIDYLLFDKNNELVELSKVPFLKDLKNMTIAGKNFYGVESRFFFDENFKNYGKSIYSGKIELFDSIDQSYSICDTTVRVSTPTEYIPTEFLKIDKEGNRKPPQTFFKKFIALETIHDVDNPSVKSEIKTTQPALNTDMYQTDVENKTKACLLGCISPATLGTDLSKKDNAEAQREKEKVTIMTRNTIISKQKIILWNLIKGCLEMYNMLYGSTINDTSNFKLKFDEFANPSLENQLTVIGQARAMKVLTTKRAVNLLWAGKLTEEQMDEEIKQLEKEENADSFTFEGLGDDTTTS